MATTTDDGAALSTDPLIAPLIREARVRLTRADHEQEQARRQWSLLVALQQVRRPLALVLLVALVALAAALWWAWPVSQSERLAGPDKQTERPFAGPDGRVP